MVYKACKEAYVRCSLSTPVVYTGAVNAAVVQALNSLADDFVVEGPVAHNQSLLSQRLFELGVAVVSAGNSIVEAQCGSNLIQITVAWKQGIDLPAGVELDELC